MICNGVFAITVRAVETDYELLDFLTVSFSIFFNTTRVGAQIDVYSTLDRPEAS